MAQALNSSLDVAGFLEIDDQSIINELPAVILEKITSKITEFASIKSQHVMDEVTIENTVRSSNEKVVSLEEKVKKLTLELQNSSNSSHQTTEIKIEFERKIQILESRNEELNERLKELKERSDIIAREKLDILQTVDRKSQEVKDLRSDVDEARKQMLDAKKQQVEYNNEMQQMKSAHNSSRIKQQNLEQEIEMLKRSNEWLDGELNSKTEEFKQFRSDKIAKIASLESDLSALRADHRALTQSSESATSRLASISEKYDEALVKIKDLQNAQKVLEENFRTEMASQQRLGELWEKSAKDAKERVVELEKSLSSERKREGGDVAKWRNTAETYRLKAEKLKNQLQALESELHTVHNETAAKTPGPPSTPINRQSPNIGMFSPSAQIISEVQKNGGSLVQLYADFQETKVRLEREKHKNEVLRAEMDNILEEMEAHAPAILSEREANKRYEQELAEMSVRLEKATSGYEKIEAEFKRAEVRLRDSDKERILVSQQVTDLSRQVQQLLIQNQLLSDSDSAPINAQESAALKRMMDGQEFSSDTQQVISERLILFKDVIELQRQNENLIKVTRELGQKMEEEESKNKRQLGELESNAVEEAKTAIIQLQNDLTQKTSYADQLKHERDMFRDMLDGKEQSSTPKSNANDAYIQRLISQTDEANERLHLLQQDYDHHRNETTITIRQLNEQINQLSSARADLQIQVSKAHSQVELTNERYKVLSETLETIKQESSEIKRRNQELQDTLLKQDTRTQHTAEELIEARSRIESIELEAANLKSEKSLWKSIETRLSQENAELLEERGRLNGLLSNVQMLESEREARDAESQRQLVAQVTSLTSQIEILQNKLDQEQNEVRRITDKRDADLANAQDKIERLSNTINSLREEQINSKSSVNVLESKAKELQDLLKYTQEQLSLYKSGNQEASETSEGDDARLRYELASTRTALELAQKELKLSQEHNKELTELAAASEEGLENINRNSTEFKDIVTKQIEAKDEEISKLKEELTEIKTELEKKSEELNAGKSNEIAKISALESEKVQLEASIKSMKENDKRLTDMEKQLKNDIQQQREIAKSAQENYEQELVKHGNTTDQLQQVRRENREIKEQIIELTSAAKQASEVLHSAQESWDTQRYTYEHEIEELKSRIEETVSQNKLLLDQLENLSKSDHRALNVEKERNDDDDESTAIDDTNSSEYFRGIIGYLKREKELAEEKYDISSQDNKRLKQRLDHTSITLEEVRLELKRLREEETGERSKKLEEDHEKLLKEVADLNILRESNASLRSQCQYYSKKCEDLDKKLQEISSQMSPIEERLRQAVAESETKTQQIELLKKDNEHWKNRMQKVLEKQNQIDPAELESAKVQNEQLEKARQDLLAQIQQLSAQNKELSSQRQEWSAEKAQHSSGVKQINEELEKSKNDLKILEERFQKLKKESIEKLSKRRAEVANLKQQLEAAKSTTNSADIDKLKVEYEESLKKKDERIDVLENETNRLSDEVVDLQRAVTNANKSASNEELVNAQEEKKTLELKIVELESQIRAIVEGQNDSKIIQDVLDSAKKETEKERSALKEEITALNAEKKSLESRKTELDDLQKKLQEESAVLAANKTAFKENQSAEATTLQNVTNTAEYQELQAKNEASDAEIQKLQQKIAELETRQPAPTDENEFQTRIDAINKEHETAIAQLNADRDAWKARIKTKFDETLKQQRKKDSEEFQKKVDQLEAELKKQSESGGLSAEIQEKHKKDIEAAAERARVMAQKESSMRVMLLQKKAEKAEAELKALKAQNGETQEIPKRPAGPGSKLPRAALKPTGKSTTAGAKRTPSEPQQQQTINKKPKNDAES